MKYWGTWNPAAAICGMSASMPPKSNAPKNARRHGRQRAKMTSAIAIQPRPMRQSRRPYLRRRPAPEIGTGQSDHGGSRDDGAETVEADADADGVGGLGTVAHGAQAQTGHRPRQEQLNGNHKRHGEVNDKVLIEKYRPKHRDTREWPQRQPVESRDSVIIPIAKRAKHVGHALKRKIP